MAYFSKAYNYKDLGLLIGRIGLGGMMIFHGLPKLMGGPEKWEALGGSMQSLGITFLPTFWGFMAGFAEGIGGLLIVLGLLFRPAAILIILTLIVAAASHFAGGDGWKGAAHAIETGLAFFVLFFVGPGKYSVDKR
ncbi:DoxX family protein [Pedobacter psychrophilus]|uniref:DoxX family protein n=1 Tax=Pedobacter psychrophilus TaxID=1826909 RepID=A0A179DBZ5_9SPHI|nr:DoxX family protein [Pedobacter psychrophilus]OAQ38557.1 DoxX family protein [Pedobacter psychrophilus]